MSATSPTTPGRRWTLERWSRSFRSLVRRAPRNGFASATNTTLPRRTDGSLTGPSRPEQDISAPQASRSATTPAEALRHGLPSVTSDDLWSAAFREAVEAMGEDMSPFEGHSIAQLLGELAIIDQSATQEDVFLKGVRYLRSIQIPLENFKLALDLALPLTSLEPTTMTVCGIVRSVTAIAISFATADLDFAKRIGEMLAYMRYIDGCDTLGRRTHQLEIHKTLVLVYGKILEFYKVSVDILTRRGVCLLLQMIREKEHLPEIVDELLRHAHTLGDLVTNATLELTADIKDILTQFEVYHWLGKEKMDRQSAHHGQMQELRSARFGSADPTAARLPSPSDQACASLLTNATFVAWYESPYNQHLVMLGEMGCGKSVLMSFLIDELRCRNELQLPQPKLCFYYCRDHETEQITHVLSVLVLQLLEQLPGMKLTFNEWCRTSVESGLDPANDGYVLERFLRTMIGSLDRVLYVIIDGLDECDGGTRRKLVHVLKGLAGTNPRLKVLLSSRPSTEAIRELGFAENIDLSANAARDRPIAQHLVDNQLADLRLEVREAVIGSLAANAHGSAIWTNMMVNLIGLEGHTILRQVKQFLATIILPARLSDLYDRLLSRCIKDSAERRADATAALRILAVARRPLSISELAYAVALCAAEQGVLTVAALHELVDEERTLGLIRPFIAANTRADSKQQQICLVHQSVKKYVLKGLDTGRDCDINTSRSSANPSLLSDQAAQGAERCILNLCIRYLLLAEVETNNLFSDQQYALDALPQEPELFDDALAGAEEYTQDCTWGEWESQMIHYDPAERGLGGFFAYASCHWVEHLGAVDAEHLPSLSSIERLCSVGSTRPSNWIEQNRRPECALQARFPFDPTLYDPLSIVALYGSQAMVLDMLKRADFGQAEYFANSPRKAVEQLRQWAGPERLQMFLRGMRERVYHRADSFSVEGTLGS